MRDQPASTYRSATRVSLSPAPRRRALSRERASRLLEGHVTAAFKSKSDDAILRRQEPGVSRLLLLLYLNLVCLLSPQMQEIDDAVRAETLLDVVGEVFEGVGLETLASEEELARGLAAGMDGGMRHVVWESLLFDDEETFATVKGAVEERLQQALEALMVPAVEVFEE